MREKLNKTENFRIIEIIIIYIDWYIIYPNQSIK